MSPAPVGILSYPTSTGGFNPSTWSNQLFWYDPSDTGSVTVNGSSNVTNVNDKTGNGYHLDTASGSVKHNDTLSGLSVLTFAGSSDRLKSSSGYGLAGLAVTVAVVFKPTDTSPASQGLFFIQRSTADDIYGLLGPEPRGTAVGVTYGNGSGTGAANFNARASATGVLSTSAASVLVVTMSSTAGPVLYQNGSSVSISNFAGSLAIGQFLQTGTSPCYNVIGERSGATWPLFGYVGDVVGWSDAKNSTDVAAISAALQTKWGI